MQNLSIFYELILHLIFFIPEARYSLISFIFLHHLGDDLQDLGHGFAVTLGQHLNHQIVLAIILFLTE